MMSPVCLGSRWNMSKALAPPPFKMATAPDDCMICMDGTPAPTRMEFSCGCAGPFHLEPCVRRWLLEGELSCPICRTPLRAARNPPAQPPAPLQRRRRATSAEQYLDEVPEHAHPFLIVFLALSLVIILLFFIRRIQL